MLKNHIVFAVILIAAIIFFTDSHTFLFEPVNLEFEASECDDMLTAGALLHDELGNLNFDAKKKRLSETDIEPLKIGLQTYEFNEQGQFEAIAIVVTDCRHKIPYGDYDIEDGNLMLKYKVKKNVKKFQDCKCAKKLTYKITGLEKNDMKTYLLEI